MLGLLVLDDFQGLKNVLLEVLRRCVDEDTVHIAGARTTVPLRHDIGIDIFPTVLGSKTMFHHLGIVETERLELWYQLAQEDLRDTLVLSCVDPMATKWTPLSPLSFAHLRHRSIKSVTSGKWYGSQMRKMGLSSTVI